MTDDYTEAMARLYARMTPEQKRVHDNAPLACGNCGASASSIGVARTPALDQPIVYICGACHVSYTHDAQTASMENL